MSEGEEEAEITPSEESARSWCARRMCRLNALPALPFCVSVSVSVSITNVGGGGARPMERKLVGGECLNDPMCGLNFMLRS